VSDTTDAPIFQPNRETRRIVAGRPCAACNNPMKQDDLFGVRTDEAVFWMHGLCVKQILENANETEES
jgi:hypothetical protein